jgi:LacI family transcriptional regulator
MTTRNRARTKCQQTRRRIERMIRRRALWGTRLMTDRELARELGVSRWTTQAALAELEAARVIERRQGSGTYVAERPVSSRRRRSARLALIAWRHHERGAEKWNYVAEMIAGAAGVAARLKSAAEVLAFDSPQEADRLWSTAGMRRFDGFVVMSLMPPGREREFLAHLLRLPKRPVVLCDDVVRDLPVTCVVDGSFEGMRAVTRHVLRLGHRRVAFLDCYNRDATNPEKYAGYRAALNDHGVDLDNSLVIAPRRDISPSGGRRRNRVEEHVCRAVDRLLELPDPPTALIGFSDAWALPAVRRLEQRGRRVGEDFCVAGFGDSAIRRGECDRLTSCRVYPRKMGEAAARAALDPDAGEHPRNIVIRDRLYVRGSTCPARSGDECGP